MQTNDIDVSIYIITYFHEKYIRQAIESVLSQKTHYKFEIIVSDDGSSDGTMNILREYERNHSDIIRVFHNENNLGIAKNIYSARCKCRGRYIVALAGDDYWINDEKIETQANYLDEHKDIIAVGNVMECRYDFEEQAFSILPIPKERGRVFSIKNYERGETFYSHGFMMRNYFLSEEGREYFKQASAISDKVDDAVDNVLLLKKGNIFIMDIITDVYRVPRNKENSNNYNSKFSRIEKRKNAVAVLNSMYDYFGNEINFRAKYENTMAIVLLTAILDRDLRSYKDIYRSIPSEYKSPFYSSVAVRCIPKAIKFAVDRSINAIQNRRKTVCK